MFLMPSRFEPCGLNQLYSLRYGTIPIVRRVGGLADTVVDQGGRRVKATGFVFDEHTPAALLGTLERAIDRLQGCAEMARDAGRPGWLRIIPGTVPPASTSKYTNEPLPRETRMSSEHVQTFTDGNFEASVLKSGQPVLVDFWAEWCGPCKRLGPTIDQLAAEYNGKLTVGKLNVDDNQNTALKFQIRGIPAVLLFKDGQVVESVVGLAPKEDFKKVIDKHV